VGSGPVFFNAVLIDIDPLDGHAHSIERISRIVEV
jgi:calcineurin-like phosphoesterase